MPSSVVLSEKNSTTNTAEIAIVNKALRISHNILISAEIVTELTLPNRDIKHLFFLAIVMAVANCVVGLLLAFLYQFQDVLKYRQMKIIDGKVAEKSWQMDYETVCDPKVHEKANIIPHWGYEVRQGEFCDNFC